MSTRSIHNHHPEKLVSMSFQLRAKYALIIHEAAQQATGREDGTASYMRQIVLDRACDDLGLERVDLGYMGLDDGDMDRAATAMGLTRDQFMARAVQMMAAETLKQVDSGELPTLKQQPVAKRPPGQPAPLRRPSPSGTMLRQGVKLGRTAGEQPPKKRG